MTHFFFVVCHCVLYMFALLPFLLCCVCLLVLVCVCVLELVLVPVLVLVLELVLAPECFSVCMSCSPAFVVRSFDGSVLVGCVCAVIGGAPLIVVGKTSEDQAQRLGSYLTAALYTKGLFFFLIVCLVLASWVGTFWNWNSYFFHLGGGFQNEKDTPFVHSSLSLSLHIWIYTYIHIYIGLSVCRSVGRSVARSVPACLPCLPGCLFVCLPVYPHPQLQNVCGPYIFLLRENEPSLEGTVPSTVDGQTPAPHCLLVFVRES